MRITMLSLGEGEEDGDHNAKDDFDRGVRNVVLTLLSLRV